MCMYKCRWPRGEQTEQPKDQGWLEIKLKISKFMFLSFISRHSHPSSYSVQMLLPNTDQVIVSLETNSL